MGDSGFWATTRLGLAIRLSDLADMRIGDRLDNQNSRVSPCLSDTQYAS